MKKIIPISFVILLFIGSILFLLFKYYFPYKDIIARNANENSVTMRDARFWLYDKSGDTPINYINGSNYDFVIVKPERVKKETINKRVVIDLTSGFDFSSLKADKELSKKSTNIGYMITSTDFNKNLSKIKSTCGKRFCRLNYLTQILVFDMGDLSEKSIEFMSNNPNTFAIVSSNFLQENKSKIDPILTYFSVESFDCDDFNCFGDGGKKEKILKMVRLANQNKVKYMLYLNNDYRNFPISQLPVVEVSSEYDSSLILKWKVEGPHNGVSMNAHSIILSDSERDFGEYFNNYPIEFCADCEKNMDFKYENMTGKVISPYYQTEFFPETLVKGTSHSVLLQTWVNLSFEGLNSFYDIPLYPSNQKFDFNFEDFKRSENVAYTERIAWIPDWAIENAVTTLQSNPGYYTSVSPVWFEVNADGTLQYLRAVNNAELINYCRTVGITIIPTITMIDNDSADVLSEVLNNNMDAHVNEIVNLVINSGYDGIDLDYERTYIKDKDLLMEFLGKLSAKLKEKGKILSYTVLPKWGDSIFYGYAPETHKAQDWKKIGEICDQVRIMTYDYRSLTSKNIGPVAPLSWFYAVIRYAQSQIPSNKIIMGIPLYTYIWQLDNTVLDLKSAQSRDDVLNIIANYDKFGTETRSIMSNGVAVLNNSLAVYNYLASKDSWNGETVIFFRDGTWHFSSYISKSDVNNRIDLIKEAGLGGVSFWYLTTM